MVERPDHYRWSSYGCNALGHENKLITPHEEWMALGVDDCSRRSAYRALFADAPKTSHIDQIRYTNRKGLPLGRDSFKSQIETQLNIKLGSGKVGRPSRAN
jgi:putative transposase